MISDFVYNAESKTCNLFLNYVINEEINYVAAGVYDYFWNGIPMHDEIAPEGEAARTRIHC